MPASSVISPSSATIKTLMFNKTFYHFFFGFVIIIGLAFAVLLITGAQEPPSPVDNVALPQ